MKERLKYYLRGLGTGIIVTMILMMVSNANAAQSTVSDYPIDDVEEEYSVEETKEAEESIAVIEREEVMTASESVEEEAKLESEQESVIEEVSAEEASEEELVTQEAMPEESSSVQESEPVQEGSEDAGQQTVDAAVTIQVVKGDGSGTVARKLQNAGLIDNASEFDAYLMQHGYDKRIRIGTVKIEAGSTWMEIAESLSGK